MDGIYYGWVWIPYGTRSSPWSWSFCPIQDSACVKEEGDSSHVCQPYKQFVVKEDKRHLRNLMTGHRLNAPMIGQFELILIANTSLNKVWWAKDWQDSFKWVNLRPSTCIPFKDYILKVKKVVEAGNFFFHERHGMFDATPSCWKNLKEEQHWEVFFSNRVFLQRIGTRSHQASMDNRELQEVHASWLHQNWWDLQVSYVVFIIEGRWIYFCQSTSRGKHFFWNHLGIKKWQTSRQEQWLLS